MSLLGVLLVIHKDEARRRLLLKLWHYVITLVFNGLVCSRSEISLVLILFMHLFPESMIVNYCVQSSTLFFAPYDHYLSLFE